MRRLPLLPSLFLAALVLFAGAREARAVPAFDLAGKSPQKRLQLLGFLTPGTTSAPVKYRGMPRFRGFSFRVAAGERLDLRVRSEDGDPVAWVLDERYRVLAASDDADESTTDARIAFRAPRAGTYHVVFRDLDYAPATFNVSLERPGGPAAPLPTPGPPPPAPAPPPPPRAPCSPTSCALYQRWDQGACSCVDNPRCGGFVPRPCPANYRCVDDPRDDCDPRRGGADCSGVCVGSGPVPSAAPDR